MHSRRDHFIEPLKAPSKGRIEQKRDSSCARGVTIYLCVRDRFIEPLKVLSCKEFSQKRDSACARGVTVYHEQD